LLSYSYPLHTQTLISNQTLNFSDSDPENSPDFRKKETFLKTQFNPPPFLCFSHLQGIHATKATWELLTEIQHNFPEFNLEDKVVVRGDGDVTVKIKDVEQLAREGAQNVGVRCGERKKEASTKLKGYVCGLTYKE